LTVSIATSGAFVKSTLTTLWYGNAKRTQIARDTWRAQKMANEKRLIDANALLEKVLGHFGVDLAYFGSDLQFCQEAIEFAPTVDAVEVVRCKDCEYWENWGFGGGGCDREYEAVGATRRWLENDFCSLGERGVDNGK
jgi:hypothetical protein